MLHKYKQPKSWKDPNEKKKKEKKNNYREVINEHVLVTIVYVIRDNLNLPSK